MIYNAVIYGTLVAEYPYCFVVLNLGLQAVAKAALHLVRHFGQ